MTAKVPHVVATTFIILLPDVYGSIGDTCGISKLDGAPAEGSQSISLRAAIAGGIVRRATLRLSNNKIASVYMSSANTPKVTALATQTYKTGITIKTAHFAEATRLG